jgi:hypothetical protein
MNIVTVKIDASRPAGRKILREISENPQIGKFEIPGIARHENGEPIGISVDEYCDKLLAKIREHYEE